MEEENDDKYIDKFNKMDFNDVNENLLNDEKKPFLKKKIIRIIILIIIIILIALLAIFLSFILNRKNGNEEKEKKECQSGYFYPDDDKECQKCSISNCDICKGNKANNTCYSCDKNYLPFIENNIIESCELISELDDCLTRDNQTNKCLVCASNYYLVNGKCKPYSFLLLIKMIKTMKQ